MPNNTAQLFDLAFKMIMKEASPSAVVHLINGIYKRSYPLDIKVTVEPNELVRENPKSDKLEKFVSDIIITLHGESRKDTFVLEAQISDDLDMMLRIFNYSTLVAIENRIVSADGSRMQIEMPSPAVIYLEDSKSKDVVSVRINFPNGKSVDYEVQAFKVLQHKVSELENMALLLPFYILKIRKELKRHEDDGAKRKELSKKLDVYVTEIEKVLRKCKRNCYITDKDATMLLHRLSRMNKELYGGYKEFAEVDMKLEKWLDTGIDKAIDKAVKKAEAKAEAKEKMLVSQVAKAEKRLSHVAQAMKAGGEAIDKIMRYTGLSRREIAAL